MNDSRERDSETARKQRAESTWGGEENVRDKRKQREHRERYERWTSDGEP